MATMDIFNNSAFSMTSLTGFVQEMDYQPNLLGTLGIFEPMPVRTRDVFVDRTSHGLSLIPAAAYGEAPRPEGEVTRDAVGLQCVSLPKRSRLSIAELDGIRAKGSESELSSVQAEVAQRMARLRADMELTHEYHRLGALQGTLLDADGSTVIYDYATEFGRSIPAATNYELDVATTDVLGLCKTTARSVMRSLGAVGPNVQIHALAGDDFYDSLIGHPNVEKFYLNWAASNDLRQTGAFEAFTFGGITWHNYRGTDDNSTVAIAADEAKVFPVGAREVFKVAYAPHPNQEFANTLGQPVYAQTVPDRDLGLWVDSYIWSYPLYICQRPDALRALTLT